MRLVVSSSRLRSARNLLFVSLGAITVHSCATTAPPPLSADDLLVAPYSYAAGEAFDVDAFLAAFPAWLTASYATAGFDATRGATIVEDLRFGFAGAPDVGFHADRVVIWGANVGATDAVFAGTANNATKASLFERVMFEGVRSEGMQWDAGSESASLSVDKMVIDGLSARSYNLAPKAGVGEETKILRSIAAIMGSFSYDGAAYSNLAIRLANRSGEKVEINVAEAFARGYDAGAVEFQSASGVAAFIQGAADDAPVEISGEAKRAKPDAPYAKILNQPPSEAVIEILRHPTATLASATGGGATAYEIDYAEARGVDVAGALTWLARWQLPPITETELIDFGAQTMLGYREIWDGLPVYSIERAEIPAADFYWLVPSQYEVVYSGMTYELQSMVGAMENRMGPGFSTEAAPQLQQLRAALAGLGIDRVAGDSAFSWRWNGETGDASIATSADLADLAVNEMGVSVAGPNLAQWDAMARSNTPVAVAAQDISLRGFNFGLGDRGILERAFAYAAQEQGGGTGPELRQSIAAMARLSGAQAAQANPRLTSYANAVADFLAGGGRIDIVAAPAAPVDMATLQSAGQTAPQTLPDVLNLTVTHTAE